MRSGSGSGYKLKVEVVDDPCSSLNRKRFALRKSTLVSHFLFYVQKCFKYSLAERPNFEKNPLYNMFSRSREQCARKEP